MKSKMKYIVVSFFVTIIPAILLGGDVPLLKPFGLQPVNFAELERVDSILAKGFANMTPAEKELFFKYEIQGAL